MRRPHASHVRERTPVVGCTRDGYTQTGSRSRGFGRFGQRSGSLRFSLVSTGDTRRRSAGATSFQPMLDTCHRLPSRASLRRLSFFFLLSPAIYSPFSIYRFPIFISFYLELGLIWFLRKSSRSCWGLHPDFFFFFFFCDFSLNIKWDLSHRVLLTVSNDSLISTKFLHKVSFPRWTYSNIRSWFVKICLGSGKHSRTHLGSRRSLGGGSSILPNPLLVFPFFLVTSIRVPLGPLL